MSILCGGSLTTCTLLIIFVIILCNCTTAMAGFAEIPVNVTVELGTASPPFRCRHMMSDAHISWSVNGLPVAQFPNIRSGSVNENGIIVYTLTIPAEPQYNGTVVQCVAVFFDGSPTEVSPPASIFFTLNVSLPETTHFEMTPTSTPPGITEIPTNTPPGTTNFVITPSPLTVAVEQGTATFQCQHPLAVVIGWRVNGISLSIAALPNVSVTSVETPSGVTTILSIRTLLDNNGTTVECIALFIDGSSPQFTPPVALLIQDTPKQVENTTFLRDYSKDELITLWNPLPTLDINDTDPDILYTVELYQITCGQNILINRTEVAGSNVSKEGLDLMQIYKAVIAARNNVRGARNGPTAEMKETFMSLNGPTLLKLTRNSLINIKSGAPVPSYYEMTLESLDGREDLVTNITVERNGEMIAMHIEESVPPNSLWRASIREYGCESERIVTNYELSTYDLQNVVAISQLPGQISVTGELISGATATGVLVVVYSLNSSSSQDIHYIAKPAKGDRISLNVTGLTGADYGVSTFALENGLPLPSVIASPKIIVVLNSHQDRAQEQPPLIEYERATMSSFHVCITCTFLESSTTDCVAVVHQRISQLNSSGLMNIESSYKFTRSGDTAYGCIEGVNLEQYQVGVIGGKMIIMGPKSNNKESPIIIIGSIIGVLGGLIVAVIVAVVACTCLKRRRKTPALPVYSEVTPSSSSQPHTIVNIESGSRVAVENDYQSAGLPEKPAEEQPLLSPPPLPARVEDDGGSSPHVLDHGTHTLPTCTTDNSSDDPTAEKDPPPLPPRLMDNSALVSESADQGTDASPHQVNGAGDPTYAPVLTRTQNHVKEFCVSADRSTHSLPTADSVTSDPTERPAEEDPPPLPPRLMDDGTSTQPLSESGDQSTPHQVSSDSGNSTYAPVFTTTPHAVNQPAATEKVSYEDIQKYQNEQGQHYALPQMQITSKKWPVDDLHQVVYTKVKPPSIIQTGDQKTDCTSDRADDAPTGVQEVSSSQNLNGETMLVPHMDTDKQAVVGKELQERDDHGEQEGNSDSNQLESSDSSVLKDLSEISSKELPEASEKNRFMLNPLSENLKVKISIIQGESRDSGYCCSQQSESESSGNSVALEMEDDSASLSQAALDELLEASEKNAPILLSEDLEKYESRVDPSFGSQATLTDDGEFGRPTNEELPTPINSCSPGLQLERFCEQPENEGDSDELCKIKPVHCQDSCIHDDYHEALIHQMGLLSVQKAQDKVEYNNAVEESSLVHINSEQSSKSLDVDYCTPKTYSALNTSEVHELVPQCFSVSPKYSHLLMLTTIQLEKNDRLITLYFTCVILSVAYSSKLFAVINVCPVNVCVCCVMNID